VCGIAGIVATAPHGPVDRARLQRMRDVLTHRGPDDAGIVVRAGAGLAHRRLSIIDIAGGHQPMAGPDDTWIVYNGEIYNFRELRARLENRGHRFTTRCDTEVVLHAYARYGERCVEHLRGMFAFAIWDARRRRLLLARDRLGIKPLYYAQADGALLFGSEIKAVLAAGLLPVRFNRAAIPEFLAQRYIAGTETFFDGVRKLLPGHVLSWSARDGVRERRYWSLPAAVDDTPRTLDEQAAQVRARFTDAVRSHLVSDVPLGCFLSGGVDSSALAALMATMSGEPIRTFSVGFAERAFSELGYARRVAESIGSEHRDVEISAQEFFGALPSLIWHEDEPIAFPSSVPLYFVSRLARDHVKVVLTGEGADELFLGYNRYRVTALNERLGRAWRAVAPGPVRRAAGDAVRRLPSPLRRYGQRTFLMPELQGIRGLFCENFSVFTDAQRARLLAHGTAADAGDVHARLLAAFESAPGGTLEKLSHADLQTYLVELLMKQDQMSMAASIESRVPFLDHEFVEFAAALPARYKVRGWTTKAALRRALEPLVPRRIITRKKMGFPVPVGPWLRDAWAPLVDEFVLGERARSRGLFDAGYVSRLVAEHRRGEWNHGDRLWLLINLELWQRIFIDGEARADLRIAA
jgi:asparagine synthase (glutamine-hydrolysing)